MSYAIGHIIYGVPYSDAINNYLNSSEDLDESEDLESEDYFDPEEYFEFTYSGSSDIMPGWCGVLLDTIDECGTLAVSDIKLTPTESDKIKAKDKIDKLPEDLKALLDPVDVYIVWGTS